MTTPNETHLGFVQDAISRLSKHGFTIKGWSVTVVVALLGFSSQNTNTDFAWLALFAAVVFALTDAYYLALERGFVSLYNELISSPPTKELWDMKPQSVGLGDVLRTLGRPAVFLVHGATVVVSALVLFFS